MPTKNTCDGERLVLRSEVIRADLDLKGKCLPFHVCDERRHIGLLRMDSFSNLVSRATIFRGMAPHRW